MSKTLKTFIILMFLLSAAALVLGYLLFEQRETLKGRTQKLETATLHIAGRLHYQDLHSVEQINVYEKMGTPLNKLTAHAENQYIDLQETKQSLADEQQAHNETRTVLADTEQALEASQQDAENLRAHVDQKETEILQRQDQIAALESEKQGLETDITDLEQEVDTLTDDKLALQEEVKQLDQYIDELTGGPNQVDIPERLSGSIVGISPNWNFVVLNIGEQAGLQVNAEMMVHRREELIGKVRVTRVEKQMAIADIVRDWNQRSKIAVGDDAVFFQILN